MLVTLAAVVAAAALPPAIVPRPVEVTARSGWFELEPGTAIVAKGSALPTARQLQAWLSAPTGFELPIKASGNGITLRLDGDKSLGVEGYRLEVAPGKVTVTANAEPGLFYGCQSLRQLFEPAVYRLGKSQNKNWQIPALTVKDQPRFKWRGLMIDSARHFVPKDAVLRFIDLMAVHKFNVLHFHLTDDQGWRVEIKKYPRLTEVGAWRKETVVGRNTPEYDGIPHGGYYTQEDLREMVAYAADRHITIVPEIDMPGHMVAAIASYPQLGDGKPAEVLTKWGVSSRVLNTSPHAVQFCKDVLTEILDIFPSRFVHVGGDECPKDQWKNDPTEQAKIKDLGLVDEHGLQSWFIRQMDSFLTAKGRRLIGWDEILEGGLAENAAVMSWRGTAGGITAAQQGHDVVMSPTSHMYLDYYQSRDPREPLAIGGFVPLEKVYSFEPVPTEIEPAQARHILGVQGNLWAEYIKTPRHLDYMAFPRACAVAEVGWSPLEGKDFQNFLTRLDRHLQRLAALGVNFRAPKPADYPVAQWTSGQTKQEYAVMEWDVTPAVQLRGDYKVRFTFTGGAHRLDIKWAELVVDGSPTARDTHDGIAGGTTSKNEYTLRDVPAKVGSKVVLRASVRSDGGTDSSGNIYIERG